MFKRKEALRLRTELPGGRAWRRWLARAAQWACGAIVGHDWRQALATVARVRRRGYRDRDLPRVEVRGCARCGRVEHLDRATGRYVERAPVTVPLVDGRPS